MYTNSCASRCTVNNGYLFPYFGCSVVGLLSMELNINTELSIPSEYTCVREDTGCTVGPMHPSNNIVETWRKTAVESESEKSCSVNHTLYGGSTTSRAQQVK